MAKADNALQEYWDDEEKFADLFNAKLFGGKKVILPEHLMEADSRKTAVVKRSKGKAQETALMYRDLVKVAKIYPEYGVELVILGLENQEHIHYAMPMRTMGYDYSEYKKQHRKLARYYKENPKGMTEDEFLSKMKRSDKLHPVITIVMYYGEKAWDGAKTLHEMLDVSEEIKPYVNDYKMHLIEVKDNNLPLSNPNNRTLFQLCSIVLDEKKTDAQKREAAMQYEKEHKIDEEVLYALAGATNCDLRKEDERGEMTMCTFFENMKEEGRQEGRQEGRLEGRTEGAECRIIGQTLKKIAKSLTVEETADMLETDISVIKRIYDIKASNPEYGEKEIFEAMQKEN